jgi:hypothetical protein
LPDQSSPAGWLQACGAERQRTRLTRSRELFA